MESCQPIERLKDKKKKKKKKKKEEEKKKKQNFSYKLFLSLFPRVMARAWTGAPEIFGIF